MAQENVIRIKPYSQVLVLNSSYEPLNIVSWKRAVVLLLKEKAYFVSAKVIRLVEYIKVPFVRVSSMRPSRSMIYKRDGHKCQYCGSTRSLTIDHITPKSRGGKDTWDNLVVACGPCNTRKADRPLEQTGMRLKKKPSAPANKIWFIVSESSVPEWMKYSY
jgi:5-methylcytosine-specific restriction endonuclease McrA